MPVAVVRRLHRICIHTCGDWVTLTLQLTVNISFTLTVNELYTRAVAQVQRSPTVSWSTFHCVLTPIIDFKWLSSEQQVSYLVILILVTY